MDNNELMNRNAEEVESEKHEWQAPKVEDLDMRKTESGFGGVTDGTTTFAS